MNAPVRRSPLAKAHEALGARAGREGGWEVVLGYAGETSPLEKVSIVDVTPRAKVDVRGATAPALGAAGDALVAEISDTWALVLGEPGAEEILLPKLEQAAGPGSMVTDATHLHAGFALAGPRLAELLARATGWDPATLVRGAATGAPIVDVPAVVVRRDLGVPVLEVYVATELARYAWGELLATARSLGGGPAGWDALRAQGWS